MLGIILLQIARVRELSTALRGAEASKRRNTDRTAYALLIFMILFLVLSIGSAIYYKDSILGYGPWSASSEHGHLIDEMVSLTLFFTGIVFIITHIVLFWFAYRYRETKSPKASFISHDNNLEIIWTLIPALVMTYLVVGGLDAWNYIMADFPEEAVIGQDYIEIEATGYQFAWDLRYPGEDNLLGERNFRKISGTNPLGQVWEDYKNHDDFMPSEIVLPVGVPVRVRITSKDVLHNFYLPHFRVKMDAVPGMPTYFTFTPMVTTDSMRSRLSAYPEYQVASDESEPNSPARWEVFDYELACAELCGKSHFSMRRIVKIVSAEEYNNWLAEQSSLYMSSVRNTDSDPYKGQLIPAELSSQRKELLSSFNTALMAKDSADRVVRLKYVYYNTGSANLKDVSQYELNNVVDILKNNPNVSIEIAGHTDNVGDPSSNLALSQDRAQSVASYLESNGIPSTRFTSVTGYGSNHPVADNSTDEGRATNRRTEFIVHVNSEK